MDDSSSNLARLMDRGAILLSGICLLHCLTLPLVIALLPFISSLGGRHFHAQVLLVVVPVSLAAFTPGFRRHGSKGVIAWGAIGIALLLFGATIAHDSYGIVADRVFTIGGALILAAAHFFNSRFSSHRVVANA